MELYFQFVARHSQLLFFLRRGCDTKCRQPIEYPNGERSDLLQAPDKRAHYWKPIHTPHCYMPGQVVIHRVLCMAGNIDIVNM